MHFTSLTESNAVKKEQVWQISRYENYVGSNWSWKLNSRCPTEHFTSPEATPAKKPLADEGEADEDVFDELDVLEAETGEVEWPEEADEAVEPEAEDPKSEASLFISFSCPAFGRVRNFESQERLV